MVDEIHAKDMRLIDANMMTRDGLLAMYGDQIKLDPIIAERIIKIGETVPGKDISQHPSLTLTELVRWFQSKPRPEPHWQPDYLSSRDHPFWDNLPVKCSIDAQWFVSEALFEKDAEANLLVSASVGRFGEPRFIPPSWWGTLGISLDLHRVSWGGIPFDELVFLNLSALPSSLADRLINGALRIPWHTVRTVEKDIKRVLENMELLYQEEEYLIERTQHSIKTMREHNSSVSMSPFGPVTNKSNIKKKRRPGAPSKREKIRKLYEQRRTRDIPLTTLNAEADGIRDDYLEEYAHFPSINTSKVKSENVIKHLKALGFYDSKTKSFITENKTP